MEVLIGRWRRGGVFGEIRIELFKEATAQMAATGRGGGNSSGNNVVTVVVEGTTSLCGSEVNRPGG